MFGFDFEKYSSYREDNRLEIKKGKNGLPLSIWETYSAFANCYGGVIIIGLEEKEDGSYRPAGLKDDSKLLKELWNTINNPNKVSINLLRDKDVKVYKDNDNVVITIEVPPARREQKPVYLNNDLFTSTFRRNGEGDYRCSKRDVLAMVRDEPDETMDMKVLDDMPIEEIDVLRIGAYRNRHRAYTPEHPWTNLPTYEYMQKIGAAAISRVDNKLHPTAAGLLMFGEEYQIVREFPSYFLDFRQIIDTTNRWDYRFISSSGEWSGSLFDFYFKAFNKLAEKLDTPFNVVNGVRQDDTKIHKAVREALVNCICNADYHIGICFVIRMYNDRFILENPGYIRVGKYQMLSGGLSDPRNKAIMKMFNLLGFGEKAGSGFPGILHTWKDAGYDAPTVEEDFVNIRTILTLPFTKTANKKVLRKSADEKVPMKSADEKRTYPKTKKHIDDIINAMGKNGSLSTIEISELLDIQPRGVRKILNLMLADDIIEEFGEIRKRRYRLKQSPEKNKSS